MWSSTYKCTRKSNHHYELVTESERDPRIWPNMAPKCRMCGKHLSLAKVENLAQIDYSRIRKRRGKIGFKGQQLELF